jgi:hypothetical protein
MGASAVNTVLDSPGVQRWADRCEWLAVTLGLAGLLVLQVFAACRYRFNTDEPQHLHVIWGWMHGLVQYRDIFDNHPPLFHMLMTPLMSLFPERADIVVPMRLMMIPLHVASLAAIFYIGRSLYSARAGAWLALIGGALPWAFFPGTEFRPDNLYVALLFWGLATVLGGRRLTRTRMAVLGLLLGICVDLTMKTALGMASLALASTIALGLRCWLDRWRIPVGEALLRLALCGAASLVAPGLLCLYFAKQGALRILIYCVLRHNVVPHAYRWGGSDLHYFYPLMALPFLLAWALWIFKQGPDSETATRRVVISLFALIYLLLYFAYWPELTGEDQLPWVPLLPLALMPLVAAGARRIPRPAAFPASYLLPPAAFLFAVFLIFRAHMIQRASVEKYVRPIATVLRLTKPGEDVMDVKGDAIYRPRPFYYAIETFTRVRMRLGWIQNDIVPDLIATRTAVCFHPPYPGDATMAFIGHNYLTLALEPRVMVLGQKLAAPAADGAAPFQIAIPAEYVFLRQGAPVAGTLDGVPCNGPLTVAAGPHRFIPATPGAPVTLFWARAWRLGSLPAN